MCFAIEIAQISFRCAKVRTFLHISKSYVQFFIFLFVKSLEKTILLVFCEINQLFLCIFCLNISNMSFFFLNFASKFILYIKKRIYGIFRLF